MLGRKRETAASAAPWAVCSGGTAASRMSGIPSNGGFARRMSSGHRLRFRRRCQCPGVGTPLRNGQGRTPVAWHQFQHAIPPKYLIYLHFIASGVRFVGNAMQGCTTTTWSMRVIGASIIIKGIGQPAKIELFKHNSFNLEAIKANVLYFLLSNLSFHCQRYQIIKIESKNQ